MRTTTAALCLCVAVAAAAAQPPAPAAAPEVVVDRAGPDIFPELWRGPKVAAAAEPLDERDRPRCRQAVEKVLAKYPPAVLAGNLKAVYVLGGLTFSGIAAAGTYSPTAVYVVGHKHTAAQLEDLFHAEFSSVLLRNHPAHLDAAAWHRLNPPGFTYLGSGTQAVQGKQASLRTSAALHEAGFIHEYARASLEEDFNTYAARLLMGDAVLWRAAETYPKVKAKADLVVAFYGKLDASYTPAFFAALRKPG